MRSRSSIRIGIARTVFCRRLAAVCLACGCAALQAAQASQAPNSDSQPAQGASPVALDSVVAVVNRHVILASDLDDEIRLSVLDPNGVGQGPLTRQRALEQLISRALIEQQIRQEDAQAAAPPRPRSTRGFRKSAGSCPRACARTAPRTRDGRLSSRHTI